MATAMKRVGYGLIISGGLALAILAVVIQLDAKIARMTQQELAGPIINAK